MRRQTSRRGQHYQRPSFLALLSNLAANTRRLREARGWSQEECAFQCDELATFVLQGIEAGTTNVTAATLARLADGLDVSVLDLLSPADPLPRRAPGRPPKRLTDASVVQSVATPDTNEVKVSDTSTPSDAESEETK